MLELKEEVIVEENDLVVHSKKLEYMPMIVTSLVMIPILLMVVKIRIHRLKLYKRGTTKYVINRGSIQLAVSEF